MLERVSWRSQVLFWIALVGKAASALAQPTFAEPARYAPTPEEREAIDSKLAELGKTIALLPRAETPERNDHLADVVVHQKAAAWALQLGEFYAKKDVAATLAVLSRGLDRARQLAEERKPWLDGPGPKLLGYFSRVDQSVQPYALIIPEGLLSDPNQAGRHRLDVVLHGRGATLSEVNFLQSHAGKVGKGDGQEGFTLHVFGRGNNAYRWAGETDVFEAIEAVKRRYSIDDRKIVLRGFSMGGAGAWHIGLHHPSLWTSVEAGAGFSETKTYAKLKAISASQEKGLHIYDAVDYAGNAFNVPMVGYGGDKDPQRQASINIQEALQTLGYSFTTEGLITRGSGLDFLRLVGANMGHAVDPASAKIMAAFHDEHVAKGTIVKPQHLRFTTYTTKYNQAAWLTIEQLGEHYRRASIDAEIVGKLVVVHAIENVSVLSVQRHVAESIRLGNQEFPLEGAVKGLLPNVYFRYSGSEWRQLDHDASRRFELNVDHLKQHNLQGPIDDAFMGSFLCVRGTGRPWNPLVQSWADDRLQRFAEEWKRWMRGEIRIKNDTEVTDHDIESHHLILFGDPGSNRVLAQVLEDLPLHWTRTDLDLAGTFRAGDHAPALIAPNPRNLRRYVVVNSGHTFGSREFAGTNALLYPRLGDYAVFQVNREGGTVKATGFFNEKWTLGAKTLAPQASAGRLFR